MSKLELGLKIAALSIAGGVVAGCDKEDRPQFDNCSFNSADQAADYYLRRNAAKSDRHLVIGTYDYTRSVDTGMLIEKNGPSLTELSPNTSKTLSVQSDGRVYDIQFQDFGPYIKAVVSTYCP